MTIDHTKQGLFFHYSCWSNKMKYYYWLLLQILLLLMFYITKNESLSDDFILEQFEQHSERIRRLEELCNVGNLTDDLSSREFRQKVEETHKVNSISNALTLLQFSNTVYLIFQNLLVDQHRKKAATSEFFFFQLFLYRFSNSYLGRHEWKLHFGRNHRFEKSIDNQFLPH